ncbi:MAG: TetR/AcrR family transcriptional regulator [Bacillota bacterium]|uniref:TetR family transcriptional regulator n=1 Tax=Thermanaerosceptrum fracticalcis TaxID=1712410 RepID=A0A7G6DYU8_THEFR|nr:TetR/AcrR family transcriptional regulator [Thermanaerosceptrum fracticalcis]QNB45002.1 TetR family transcriptional regulator [Thermanaerosceptrum fracticalcis]
MQAAAKFSQAQKILDAAYECLATRGYAQVSLRDIAQKAGVVLSQLNYYYGSKQGLFIEVVNMMTKKYLARFEEYLKEGTTPQEKMASLKRFFQEMLNNDPGLFRIFYDLTGLALWSPVFSSLLRKLFRELSQKIEEYILIQTLPGENFRGYSSHNIARMILGAMYGTAIQVLLDPGEENLEDSINAIQLILE